MSRSGMRSPTRVIRLSGRRQGLELLGERRNLPIMTRDAMGQCHTYILLLVATLVSATAYRDHKNDDQNQQHDETDSTNDSG